MEKAYINKLQKRIIYRLGELFEDNKIINFNLTSMGNSIASGYSFESPKPLIYRAICLKEIMQDKYITTNLYSFTRAGSNSDEKMLDWLNSNVSINEVNRINRIDYLSDAKGVPFSNLSNEDILKYFSDNNNITIREILGNETPHSANILLYSGATGSFLNNQSRGGSHKLIYGINEDCTAIEGILKQINLTNRTTNSNTQVYLCGVPNIMGLRFSEVINLKLKKIAKKYPNTTYVPSVTSKSIHKKFANFDKKVKNSAINLTGLSKLLATKTNYYLDIHYTDLEYAKFTVNYLKSIFDNYLINEALIRIDHVLYNISNYIQENHCFKEEITYNKSKLNNGIIDIIDKWYHILKKNNCNTEIFIRRLKYLIKERYPHDYYFIDKSILINKKRI